MTGYEWLLIVASGMLGSAHCIGMCGAISATMNLGAATVRSALARQAIWSAGRTFTYAFLGMMAGFGGQQLTQSRLVTSRSGVMHVQAGFAILAGLLLIGQGLISAGVFRRGVRARSGCLTASVLGRFLKGGSATGVFVAGIATGFLPCGLVYTFLALAAASGSIWQGPLIMLAFGLGTVPVMLVTGAGFTLASRQRRQRLLKLAAVCVVVTGVLTTSRGIAFATAAFVDEDGRPPEQLCPLCVESAAKTATHLVPPTGVTP